MLAPSHAALRRRRIGAAIGGIALLFVAWVTIVGLPEPLAGRTGVTLERLVAALPQLIVLSLAVPTLVWIAARPQRGVLLLAAVVPFQGLLDIAPVAPPWWKEALAVWTMTWAVFTVLAKPRRQFALPKVVQPLTGYLLVGLVSAGYVAVRVSPIQAAVGLKISYFWLLFAAVVWLCPFDAKDRDHLVSVLMGVGLVTSLYGLLQQALGDVRLNEMGYEYDVTIRTTGPFLRSWSTFDLPFGFGLYLAMVLLIAVPVCLEDFGRLRNKLFLLCTPIIGLGLLSSFVRNAWLATIVGFAYLAVRRYRVLLLGVPFALLALVMLPGNFADRAFQSDSFAERQVGWGENFQAVTEVVGNGIGAVGSAAEKTLETLDRTDFFYQPDNQYFKVVYELGVLGLAFFVMALVYAFIETRAVVPRVSGTDLAFVEGFAAHILGVAVACVSANYFETFPVDVMFWLLLGIVLTCGRESS